MPFHSPTFALLCVVTLALYYARPVRRGDLWQHAVLLLASLVFYAYAGLPDLILLLGVVLANHAVARFTSRRDQLGRHARIVAVVGNLSVLAYFKYRGMVVGWTASAFGTAHAATAPMPIAIPLGISFYVFQLIAYQVDLSRGRLQREPSALRLLLYVLFFPHHQAGPIMRPGAFLPQFYGEKAFDADAMSRGGFWILLGLGKKIAADNIAPLVDEGFRAFTSVNTAAKAWALALGYAAQIYGDFSGYSDIAVGLGLLFGYRLDRNFDQPYLCRAPSELWRRWHVTLSAWLRDYLYIPLGGNRGGRLRSAGNAMLTMLLGGLWHGASLNFVAWGAMHGALVVLERFAPRLFRLGVLGWIITFGWTVFAWVPFRATSSEAAEHLAFTMLGSLGAGTLRQWTTALAIAGALVGAQWLEEIALHGEPRRERLARRWMALPGLARGLLIAVAIVSLTMTLVDRTAFIYFRF